MMCMDKVKLKNNLSLSFTFYLLLSPPSLSPSLSPAILAFVILKDGVTDDEDSIITGLKSMVKELCCTSQIPGNK